MSSKNHSFAMKKNSITIVPMNEKNDDINYWKKRSKKERMEALEFLRTIFYKGYHGSTSRLQRVLSVVKRKKLRRHDLKKNKKASARLKDLNDLANLPK